MNEAASKPIGVFDSGIGGLTVVKALRELLPQERIVYLGDTARVPYGSRSASTVERYSLEIAEMLMERQAKLIVVACNTASSVALPKLEKSLPVNVIGVIRPGAQAAIQMSRNRHIGVIGTRATIRSGSYEKALRLLDEKVSGHEPGRSASGSVDRRGSAGGCGDRPDDRTLSWANAVRRNRYARPRLHPLSVACRRYPASADGKVALVDSARNCALAVQQLLDKQGLGAPAGGSGDLHVALTDAPDNFLRVAKEALQLEIGEVELREVLHPAKM